MLEKLLVVEPSKTIQRLFSKQLPEVEYNIEFAATAIEAFEKIGTKMPTGVFVNAELDDIDGFEFVRLLKKFKGGDNLYATLYCVNPVPLNTEYSCPLINASNILMFVEESLEARTAQEYEKSGERFPKVETSEILSAATKIWRSDIQKNELLKKIYALVVDSDSVKNVVSNFLSICTDVCRSPMACMFLIEVDKISSYYVAAEQITEQTKNDFFNICVKDFEDSGATKEHFYGEWECVPANFDINACYSQELDISACESRRIVFSSGQIGAVIDIARCGNFSLEQQNLINFAVENFSIVLENALSLKTHVFYESQIRKAFSRFVPAEIIDDLAKKDVQQDIAVGEKRDIAILFSDIRSFTNISEKNRPEVLVAFLNRYFTVMVDIIKKYGGTIDKFIGDAIMAEFGTPISYEDNARRAAKAAYEMRKALPDVPLEDLVMPDGMTFNIGIGIHYGDAIVGSIGSKDKTDYSVIGDSVNLASRLEGLTKTYGVQLIVSESMKEDIVDKGNPDEFVFRYLDDVRVKGKKKAVPIYAIDRNYEEFSAEYRDCYTKGMELYKQGVFRLAKDYFEKALAEVEGDKAAELMLDRCNDFIENPPENWDGAISFTTK
ncbi:MAG: guanylate cyclase [Treponemataceae bacterium]|nr:guanylate cyclase [Treponemataceae bacterium]